MYGTSFLSDAWTARLGPWPVTCSSSCSILALHRGWWDQPAIPGGAW